jgi:hypothetical protein
MAQDGNTDPTDYMYKVCSYQTQQSYGTTAEGRLLAENIDS